MIEYDPFEESTRENPYPVYARLRAESPVHYMEKYDAWALSRFQDIWDASGDVEHFTTSKGAAPAQILTKDQPVVPTINTTDPPEHTTLRTAVRRNFLPRRVGELEVQARELCNRMIDEARERGEMDIVREFGSTLSATIACRAIGLPIEDGPLLSRLVQGFFTHDPDLGGMTEEGLASLFELNDYCVEKIRERRKQPDSNEDALSVLASIEAKGERYTDEEAGSHVGMLVIGGTETFPKVLASAIIRMARHPDARAAILADPSLIPDAFDEVLRLDMPTQFLARTVRSPHTIDGQRLEPGQGMIFLYASANRDEREFADPDTFDIHRHPPRILSFGAGNHQCLGRHIARMEGRVSLETLLPALGDFEVDFDRAVRLKTEFVQGYGSLPIRFTPS